ncbi:MAG: PD-(D/E)XK nuclease family transposase [Lachnospiraceae bacterium]|nr:PD-(D/E)XK nuclease family transposase [Lachnospiraceae bacterium]
MFKTKKPKQIISIVIANPIQLGGHIDDKEFILDIKVRINNNPIISLEMQVQNQFKWTDQWHYDMNRDVLFCVIE